MRIKRWTAFWGVVVAAGTMAVEGVEGQVEIGVDGGLTHVRYSGSDGGTALEIPTGGLRIGFPRGGHSFETLLDFNAYSSNGNSASMEVVPGLNWSVGSGNSYVRIEVPLMVYVDSDDSSGDAGVGGAWGITKPIDDGPIAFRFQVGANYMFDRDLTRIRALVGLSARIGG